MKKRTLTIRLRRDWKAGLRSAGQKAKAKTYQGEELAFQTPADFFGRLTERRWEMVRMMQGKGAMSTRGIAGLVGRDVKRVHEDVADLLELGLLERTEEGVSCPFARIHIDIEMAPAAAA
jgi:predicted transcriptional regulator